MCRIALFALALGSAACSVSSEVSREIGARCDSPDECDELCLTAPEYPGGFCTVGCTSPADCPSGALCVDIGQRVCLYECDATPACAFLGADWKCAERAAEPDGEVMVCAGD